MKIGILSDSHDDYTAIESALAAFTARGVELLLHCGDIESPTTVNLFRSIPTQFVLGNCDWRVNEYPAAIRAAGGVLHERFGEWESNNVRIAWTHSHDLTLFHELEFCNHFDFLFYGHTHRAEQHRRGRTLVVNPGALHRVRQRSVVVLDVISGELETVDV